MSICAAFPTIALLAILASPAAAWAEPDNPYAALAGTKRITTEIVDPALKKDGVHDHPATMAFQANGFLTGYCVCNRYAMSYSPRPDGGVEIQSRFWTYLSCGAIGNMIEQRFAAALKKVRRFVATADGKLIGYDAANVVVMRFARAPADSKN